MNRATGKVRRVVEGLLNLGLDPASPGHAPTPHGLKHGEQASDHKNQANAQIEIHGDDTGDETKTPNHPPGDASPVVDIGTEELLHITKIPSVPAWHNSLMR